MNLLHLVVRTPISEALGWTLVHLLWEGAIIAAALATVLLSVRSSRVRYVTGYIALMAMVASFSVTLIYFLRPRGSGGGMLITMMPLSSNSPYDLNWRESHLPDLRTVIPWLTPGWLIGVCLFYIRYGAGWLSLYKLRRRGVCRVPDAWQGCVARLASELRISRPVALLESLLADTPVVLGHLRPVILVPLGFLAGLPPDHVEAILLHELAHIKRSDYLLNAFQRLIEGLLFYHPAVWWISHVIRAERENCCDDVVVALKGRAYDYAVALTVLEQNRLEQKWPAHVSVPAATGGNLVKRVKRLIYPKGRNGMWAPILAAVILMASTTVVLAARHLSPKPSHIAQQTKQQFADRWQKWLNEDVVYIISDQEKAAFADLKTDEEREHFVEQFWARRNPTPGAAQNEFKKEHYRRIAYANDHFAGNQPGWKTDRGRIYIRYGPPDEIESHPSGGNYRRPESEGGGSAETYPFEEWGYKRFEGVGNLTVEFVDTTSSGNFRMTLDPKEKYKKP